MNPAFKSIIMLCFLVQILPAKIAFAGQQENVDVRLGVDVQVFPDQALSDLKIALRMWLDEVSAHEAVTCSTAVYKDIGQLQTDFERHVVNLVVTSPIRFVKYFNPQHLSSGFKASKSISQPFDTLLLLTRKNAGIANFSDLQGKHIALLDNDELAEIYLDTLTLSATGQLHPDFFKGVSHEKTSHRLILKLFFNNTDAVIVYQQAYQLAVEMNPQLDDQIYVLKSYGQIPWRIGFFHRDVDSDFRQRILEEAFKIDTLPRGKQLQELFGFDQVSPANITDLYAEQAIYDKYQILKSTKEQEQ